MARWKTFDHVTLDVHEAPLAKRVPASRRVWAPKSWRGGPVVVLHAKAWTYSASGHLCASECQVKVMHPRTSGGGIVVSAGDGMMELVVAPLRGRPP